MLISHIRNSRLCTSFKTFVCYYYALSECKSVIRAHVCNDLLTSTEVRKIFGRGTLINMTKLLTSIRIYTSILVYNLILYVEGEYENFDEQALQMGAEFQCLINNYFLYYTSDEFIIYRQNFDVNKLVFHFTLLLKLHTVFKIVLYIEWDLSVTTQHDIVNYIPLDVA